MTGSTVRSESEHLALFTDLYELTMLQAYVDQGMFEPATFRPVRPPAAEAAQLPPGVRPR